MLLGDLRAVVRGPFASGLSDEEVARLLDLPLAGLLPTEPDLPGMLGAGEPPGARERGPLARFCEEVWARVLPGGGGVPA
jgi:hypothetical protein